MNIISRVFLYLLGTLRLKLSGEYCERLLNVMASHNISFWQPFKKKSDFYITVLRKDIKKIKGLRRNTGVKIKITEKRGFPLIVNKYKYRYGLIVGIILFIVSLNLLSSQMWMIKVNGNANISETQIVDFFQSLGIHRGISMAKIDSDILKQQLILSFDNIAWASVNKQGSVIEVNITEFSSQKESDAPCNIVSEYDAIIKKINVSKGSVNVKIGDTVTKNQILVSGIVNYGAGNNFVHSSGEVIAEIRPTVKINIKKIQEVLNPTNEVRLRRTIDIMGQKIPLYLGEIHGDYKVNKTYKYAKIFGGKIPIIIYKDEYSFVNKSYINISVEEAQKLANEQLTDSLVKNGAYDIKITDTKVTETEKEYQFDFCIVCMKDIGVKKPIEFSLK